MYFLAVSLISDMSVHKMETLIYRSIVKCHLIENILKFWTNSKVIHCNIFKFWNTAVQIILFSTIQYNTRQFNLQYNITTCFKGSALPIYLFKSAKFWVWMDQTYIIPKKTTFYQNSPNFAKFDSIFTHHAKFRKIFFFLRNLVEGLNFCMRE